MTKEELEKLKVDTLLEKATLDFFPKSGRWGFDAFAKSEDSLLCHLRDEKWLAVKLQKELNYEIDINEVLDYVKTSRFFYQARHDYEQRVIKWQINWMLNGGEGWLAPEEYGGDLIFFHPDCDIGFRKGIVNTLRAIGMNKDAIEEGIEKNSGLWRKTFMKIAFSNRFEPVQYSFLEQNDADLKPANSEHKRIWLLVREYEYYKNHKDSIEKYGKITDAMRLSSSQIANYYTYLKEANAERLEYIENINSKNDNVVDIKVLDELEKTQKENTGVLRKIKNIFSTKKP